MYKPTKSPVRLTIGYGLWSDEWKDDLSLRFHKSRLEYIDISDIGTGRMSKRMADNFVIFLKNGIANGSIPVAPLKGSYTAHKSGGGIGIATGEMLDSIEAFRTNLGGEKHHKGWVVSIKENKMTTRKTVGYDGKESQLTFPTWFKLSWLEYGTIHQEPRPLIARGFEMFVAQDWVTKVVKDMITRGMGMTEAKREFYNGGGE